MKKDIELNQIINAIQSVLPEEMPVALHEPQFTGNEWLYVKECLDTRWVSSVGKFVDRFEKDLAEYTGVKRAVAVVNGTSALHICLKLSGVQPGDEVLVPALTFVATANAVTYCGAVPHFVDSEEPTLGLDPCKLYNYLKEIVQITPEGSFNKITGRHISTVVPMHTFGHPVDLDPLVDVCQRFKLILVEDAAESLGSLYKGRHTGNWGLLSALSFNGNKVITTGGGGAILTNDEALGKLAKHLTTTARVTDKWSHVHDQIGFNYRLPNINAALGCAQLEQLDKFIESKRTLAQNYQEVFKNIKGVRFFTETEWARSNYWLNALLLDRCYAYQRNQLLDLTHDSGIMTRPTWRLMHKLPMFKDCPRMDLNVAESIESRLVNIPSSSFLGDIYDR